MKYALLTLFVIPFILGSTKSEPKQSIVVLELFTSQGCSSCPPADILLDKVSSDKNVIGLSYHVDYWNYIGWKDPFSKSEFSTKQRAYGRKFYGSSIYTPQVVINGKEHFVGSDTRKMQLKIDEYALKASKNNISVSNIDKTDELVNFDYEIEGSIKNLQLSIILVIDKKVTSVKRGENRNKTLTNSNVVVTEDIFGLKTVEGKGTILIPNIVSEDDDLSLVLITKTKSLDITGGFRKSL